MQETTYTILVGFFITVSVKCSFDQYDDAMVDTPLKSNITRLKCNGPKRKPNGLQMSTLQKVNLKAEHGTMQEEIPIFRKSIHFHPLGRFQDNIHIFAEYLNLSSNFHKSFYYFVHLFFLLGNRLKYPPQWFSMSTRGTGTRVLYLQGLPSGRRSPGEKKRVRRGRPGSHEAKKITAGYFPEKNWLITSWWLSQTQPGFFFISQPAETTLNPLVFALGGRGEKGVGSATLAVCLVGRKGMVSKWRHHSKTQRFPTQQILK